MPVETRPAPDARMLRPCGLLPRVPVAALDAAPLSQQVEWWRSWSVQVLASHAECAGDKELWRRWYQLDAVPLR